MPPIHLLIKPASSLCNMRCRYCFYADVAERRAVRSYGLMSEETLEAVVQKAFAYAEKSATFAFQGGEPLLAGLPFYEAFVRLVQRYNIRRLPVHYALQTNGLLIDDAWAALFGKHHFLIGLSMDGGPAIHNALRPDAAGEGTHSRVLEAASRLKAHGCEYNILCVVTRPIAKKAASVYRQLREHRYLQFIPCIDDFGEAPGDYSLSAPLYGHFLKQVFDLYYDDFARNDYVSVRAFDNYVHMLLGHPPENCAMNGLCTCNLVVEGDGSAYPCDFYVLDEWRLGNLREDSVESLLQGEKAREFIAMSRPIAPECKKCRWGGLCRGGCRRDREATDGLGSNRFCEAYREFFAYAETRLIKLARTQPQG